MKEVIIPRFGDSIERVAILAWKVKEGDTVGPGDILCEVETDKTVSEIQSFHNGTVLRILAPEGTEVSIGDIVAVLGDAGEELTGESAAGNETGTSAAAEPASGPVRAGGHGADENIKVLPRTRNLARELGVDLRQVKATGGRGEITEEDVRKAAGNQSADR